MWVLLAAVALASCAEPGVTPETRAGQANTSIPASTTTTAVPTTTTTAPPPPPAVAPDDDQEGFAAPQWDDTAYGEDAYRMTLEEVADTGAEWVTIIPTWYQEAVDSSSIYAELEGRTATDDSLRSAIRRAGELGLKVTLKPHVDPADGSSRLDIRPADEEQWFASYERMLLGYARMAAELDVDQFIVGTELSGTIGAEGRWRELIAEVRDAYPGPISYAANHDSYRDVEFWDALDFIGIDAYFPLADQPTTDVDRLVEAWQPIVEAMAELSSEFGRSVVLTEIGYPSQQGAVIRPFNPSGSGESSEEEQAAGLRAMLAAFDDEEWFGGFHWWMWFEEDDPAEQALGYTPEGKAAEAVLRDRWAGE